MARGHRPADREEQAIRVIKIYLHKRESEKVGSIGSAIEAVKAVDDSPDNIVIEDREDDIVYSSEKHGDIEGWERQWRQQLRRLSGDKIRECPHGNSECTKHDLCLECQMDEQRDGL